jgi:ABC-2 type transport system ATP-binding protein
MDVIEVRNLTKRFGSTLAVDDVSFSVARGTVCGFLGPNGAGKTTTLRMLLGLVAPTSGAASISGQRYAELSRPLSRVGAVLEQSSFHPGRTGLNHLRSRALVGGVPSSRVGEVLERVGLSSADGRRRVGEYSLGMRQRLGLGAALLTSPEVLILDEPANGLDPEGVRWLRDLVRGLARDGATVLVSSHILAEVAQTVDEVLILDRGRLVAHGALDQLMAGSQRVVRVRTPMAEKLRAALVGEGAAVEMVDGDRLEITGTDPERIGWLAAELGVPIFESTSELANLEDVFFQLTAASTLQEASR